MPIREIPIDGEPCGVLAFPIPEQGDLRFVELFDRYQDALGRSGAKRIVWRPVGNPRSTDEAYEEMRSPDQKVIDEYAAGKYDAHVVHRGGELFHRSRENNKLARMLRISEIDRPCVLLASSPRVGRPCMLRIPRAAFRNRDSEDALGDWLVEKLTFRIVEDVLVDGFLNEESIARLAMKIAELERELSCLWPGPTNERSVPDTAYCRLTTGDAERFLDRSEYDDLIAEVRRSYHLLVDVVGGKAYCRRGRRQRTVPLRPRAVQVFAEAATADRSIRLQDTEAGSRCTSTESAKNSFYEARSAIQKALGHQGEFFTVRRGLTAEDTRFEFSPPKSLLWGIVEPVKHYNSL